MSTDRITAPESITPSQNESELDQEFFDFVATLNTPQKRLLADALRTVNDLDLHIEEFKVYMEDVFKRMKALEETGDAS